MQQARGFGLDFPPEQMDGFLNTFRCEWKTTIGDRRIIRTVFVSMFTNNPTLETSYTKNQSLPFFELTEIADYPTIVTRTNADLPSCDIDIKTAEHQSMTVIYESKEFNNNPQQACEVGKQVAEAMLMNIPLKG
jgi:hypothetical protein